MPEAQQPAKHRRSVQVSCSCVWGGVLLLVPESCNELAEGQTGVDQLD